MIILDASVILARIQNERGTDQIDLLLETQTCGLPIINLCEVQDRLLAHGGSIQQVRDVVADLPVRVLPFDRAVAEITAALRSVTAHHGIGIADRACIATGMQYDARVMTADRAWADLDLPGVDITIIR